MLVCMWCVPSWKPCFLVNYRLLVGWSFSSSIEVCEKFTLGVSIKSYLPTYLPTYLCDSSNISDSSVSSGIKKKFSIKKIKNSNCDKTQKFQLCQNSKIQIMIKLKNSKFDKPQKLKL